MRPRDTPVPPLITFCVLAINALTFAAFGIDKWKAGRGERRIPQARLLAMSFATGAIGGWIGMWTFRHKTAKASFRRKMAAVTTLNLLWPTIYVFWPS